MRTRFIFSLAIVLSVMLGISPSLTIASALYSHTTHESKNAGTYNDPGRGRGNHKALNKTVTANSRASRLAQTPDANGQSVTLLADGSLLLLGGQGSDGPLATAVIKPAIAGESITIPAGLQRARTRHTATLLPSGTVLIVGGIGADGQILDSVELFNPATRKSEIIPSAGVSPRVDHCATLLTSGQVLIAGGTSANGKAVSKAELWDSQTRSAVVLPARLNVARQQHTATLLPDGRVLLNGGKDGNGRDLYESEAFDPEALRFIAMGNFVAKEDANAPFMMVSLPMSGEGSVPTDRFIAVRFSKPLAVETVNANTVTLASPQGQVSIKVVAAEGGRLAFITPQSSLLPNTAYTVSLAGGKDNQDQSLAYISFTFTTVGAQDHEHSSTDHQQHHGQIPGESLKPSPSTGDDDESWLPDRNNPYGNWRSNRQESEWEKLPPLQAGPGVTALSGRVLKLNGEPLSDVTLQVGDKAARTDATGRFLITSVTAGYHSLLINGATASHGNKLYASFENGIDIEDDGQTNVLPYTIWLPLVDTKHAVRIPTPTRKEVVITTPLIPGLEIRIPKGVRLRSHDGSYLKELTITPIPVDRTPMPLPPGTQLFFSPQAHGATVETIDGSKSVGVRIIYPNVTGLASGSRVGLFDYDQQKGWYVYGEGTVSKGGKQVVPNEGVGLQVFKCAYYMYGDGAPDDAPQPGDGNEDGDPVDLGTGLLVYSQTDLVLPDTMPIIVSRTYRQKDSADRPFGKGATDPYDMYLWFSFWTAADLVLPNGSKIHYDQTSNGWEHTATPTTFYKSTITGSQAPGFDLKFKDGTIYHFKFKVVGGSTFASYARVPLEWVQDRNGNRLVITRDDTADLRITKITSPNGKWVEFSYEGSSRRIAQIRDNIGRTVNYTYDASSRLWKVTDSIGRISEYTYDASHRMLTIKDPRGTVYLANEYDANGRISKQTLADNTVYQFAYTLDGNGKVTQTDATDPRGNTRRIAFTSNHYTLWETYALGKSEQQTYNFEWQAGTNLPLSMTDALGRRTAMTYDSSGNLMSITRLAGTASAVTTTFTYEPNFNKAATVVDPLNHTTTYAYDSKGNLTSVTDPLGNQATYVYNTAGQVTSATDAETKTWTYGYSSGDLVRITDPLGNSITRFADAGGRVTRLSNALGHTVGFEYDALNRVVQVIDPLQGSTSFSYDANHNLLSVTDPRNNVISYSYNNMDRNATRTDVLQHNDSYLYDDVGNLQQVTDRKGQVTTYTYDALSRLTLVTFADSSTISYTYDAGNRLTQIVDSTTGTITYGYDNRDRLTSETSSRGAVSYTYDTAGRLATMTAPGQAAVSYTYDNANRLTQITQGTATVTMSYDHIGRPTSQTQPNGVTTEYSYDGASHLTSIVYKKGAMVLGNLTYNYDAAGRRIAVGGSFARTGLPQALTSIGYNNANQQTSFNGQTLAYDLNGNLTSDGVNTYGWNARDELVSVSGTGLSASFQYDAVGRRVSKTINGATTALLYSGGNVVQEQTGGTASANLLSGGTDQFFSRTDASGTSSPLVDGLGSAIALTDSSGTVQTSYSYEPFGQTTTSGAASSNPSQYSGRDNDGTGLYYYRARYYSPSRQRFISEDPIGLSGGFNLYAYVANNPISFSDPSGLSPFGDFAWGVHDVTNPFAGMPEPYRGPGAPIDNHIMPDMYDLFGPPNRNSICYKLGEATGIGLALGAGVAEPVLGLGEEIEGAGGAARAAEREAGSGSKSPCFVAGTPVLTVAGSKPIEQIAAGEQVISTDPAQGVTTSQTVSRTFVRAAAEVIDIKVGSVTITATPEHPFWVEGQGWRAAGDLQRGAKLRTKDGGIVEVESVAKRRGEFAVYNLEVTSIHSYYVSELGILVHNQCGGAGGGGNRPPSYTPPGAGSGTPKLPNVPTNPGDSPGPDYNWRGKQPPGNPDGAWHNPKTNEYMRPHMHPSKHGPHWDYRAPDGSKWRIYPDGSTEQKP